MSSAVVATVTLVGTALAGAVIGFVLGVIAGDAPNRKDRT